MEGSTKFIIGIAVVVLVGLPLMGQLAKKPVATAPAPAPRSSTESPASEPPPAPPPQQPQGPPPPMSLANTAWTLSHREFGTVTIELYAGGQGVAKSPKLPMPVQGTWVQNGNSLTFSAMGQTISAQLNGNQLMANGVVARRLR